MILKEIFSNLGFGTMVYADQYENLRPMERRDIPEVLRLMEPFVRREILVPRSEEQLERALSDFVVYEVDKTLHGCGALHVIPASGERAPGLRGDRGHRRERGVRPARDRQEDRHLPAARAAEAGLRRVFALTTQTTDWFLQLGFRPGGLEDLPPAAGRPTTAAATPASWSTSCPAPEARPAEAQRTARAGLPLDGEAELLHAGAARHVQHAHHPVEHHVLVRPHHHLAARVGGQRLLQPLPDLRRLHPPAVQPGLSPAVQGDLDHGPLVEGQAAVRLRQLDLDAASPAAG